jgi:hypothetical protein
MMESDRIQLKEETDLNRMVEHHQPRVSQSSYSLVGSGCHFGQIHRF